MGQRLEANRVSAGVGGRRTRRQRKREVLWHGLSILSLPNGLCHRNDGRGTPHTTPSSLGRFRSRSHIAASTELPKTSPALDLRSAWGTAGEASPPPSPREGSTGPGCSRAHLRPPLPHVRNTPVAWL